MHLADLMTLQTDEAKSDLARLRKIREEREKLKLQREAESQGKYIVLHRYSS